MKRWTPSTTSRRRVVHSQKISERRFLKKAGIWLAVIFVSALLHVATRVQVVQTGYQIRQLTEQQETLKGEQHTLRVEVATLRSPVRLEKVAQTLGLKRPPEKQVTLLSSRTP